MIEPNKDIPIEKIHTKALENQRRLSVLKLDNI